MQSPFPTISFQIVVQGKRGIGKTRSIRDFLKGISTNVTVRNDRDYSVKDIPATKAGAPCLLNLVLVEATTKVPYPTGNGIIFMNDDENFQFSTFHAVPYVVYNVGAKALSFADCVKQVMWQHQKIKLVVDDKKQTEDRVYNVLIVGENLPEKEHLYEGLRTQMHRQGHKLLFNIFNVNRPGRDSSVNVRSAPNNPTVRVTTNEDAFKRANAIVLVVDYQKMEDTLHLGLAEIFMAFVDYKNKVPLFLWGQGGCGATVSAPALLEEFGSRFNHMYRPMDGNQISELQDDLLIRLASVVSQDPSLMPGGVQQNNEGTQLMEELKKEREDHSVTKTRLKTVEDQYNELLGRLRNILPLNA